MKNQTNNVVGYLPDEVPTTGKLVLFALQQVLIMFPATVTVALLTGFHVSTTIFASGLATLVFLLITKRKIPLYYGSSFSYIAAIISLTGVKYGELAPDHLISQAQFGIIMSGLVSIAAGLLINKFGIKVIEKILPPTITGPIAIIIGISLAGVAITGAAGFDGASTSSPAWIAALVTLAATVLFSVYLKGIFGQLSILFGILTGYLASIALGLVDFSQIFTGHILAVPHFTFPSPSWQALIAIMPIAIATIPESTAHLFQLDIYVNDLARKRGKDNYKIEDKLGLNLIGDGIGDMVSALFGGPAGTNYGENLSAMAITKNFSSVVLMVAAVLAMGLSFVEPISNAIRSIPGPVVNGACIFLFGAIGAQGIAIMIEKKVDMFSVKNLAVTATILVIGLGGHYGFPGGNIPIFNLQLPAIATAAIVGIIINLALSFKKEE